MKRRLVLTSKSVLSEDDPTVSTDFRREAEGSAMEQRARIGVGHGTAGGICREARIDREPAEVVSVLPAVDEDGAVSRSSLPIVIVRGRNLSCLPSSFWLTSFHRIHLTLVSSVIAGGFFIAPAPLCLVTELMNEYSIHA